MIFNIGTKSKRKRNRGTLVKVPSKNIYEIIESYVVPKWKSYLEAKTVRRENDARLKPRNDTLWKKMVRDTREFFRILFRKRFEAVNQKCSDQALACIKILFDELGINITKNEEKDFELYKFLHQTHFHTTASLFETHQTEQGISSPFGIMDRYNEDNFKFFMRDSLASRMIYFVFSNYLKSYVPLISKNYKKRLTIIICCLLNWYKKMKKSEDLERIYFWIS